MESSDQKISPVKATIDLLEKAVIEKIDTLGKKLEQSHLDNAALTLEVNRLKSELGTSQKKANELEQKNEYLREMFNQIMMSGGQKNSPVKATIDRWKKGVIIKINILGKKLEQTRIKKKMDNEEISTVRSRLVKPDEESFETIDLRSEETQTSFEEALKKKLQTETKKTP